MPLVVVTLAGWRRPDPTSAAIRGCRYSASYKQIACVRCDNGHTLNIAENLCLLLLYDIFLFCAIRFQVSTQRHMVMLDRDTVLLDSIDNILQLGFVFYYVG